MFLNWRLTDLFWRQQCRWIVGRGCDTIRRIVLRKFSVAQAHCLVKIFCGDGLGDLVGEAYRLHQWLADNLVLNYGDDWTGRFWLGVENSFYSLRTLQCREQAIVSRRGSAALNVSQGSDPSVEVELIRKEASDHFWCNLPKLPVYRALSNNDSGFPLATLSTLLRCQCGTIIRI